MWMLLREDCTNLIQCSGVFNMGICAFAPHLSKSLDQFCSLRSEQSPMQFILNWTSLHEFSLDFYISFLQLHTDKGVGYSTGKNYSTIARKAP